MGTDRYEVHRARCNCGEGEFVIDRCEVDHSWPTATPVWHEGRISCPNCASRFQMHQRRGRFVLVELVAIRDRERRLSEASRARSELLGRTEILGMLEQAIRVLEGERSVAATQRLLKQHGLDAYSYSAFNKQWSGAADWVRRHATPSSLERLCALTGSEIPGLQGWLSDLAAVEAMAQTEAPEVGAPVYAVDDA